MIQYMLIDWLQEQYPDFIITQVYEHPNEHIYDINIPHYYDIDKIARLDGFDNSIYLGKLVLHPSGTHVSFYNRYRLLDKIMDDYQYADDWVHTFELANPEFDLQLIMLLNRVLQAAWNYNRRKA